MARNNSTFIEKIISVGGVKVRLRQSTGGIYFCFQLRGVTIATVSDIANTSSGRGPEFMEECGPHEKATFTLWGINRKGGGQSNDQDYLNGALP